MMAALPANGSKVVIPKGAYIETTHPQGDRIAKRSQVVTVHHTLNGYDDVPSKVCWAGSGGYWCQAWEWCPPRGEP